MLHILYVEDDPSSRHVVRMVQRMNPDVFTLTLFEDSRDFMQRLSALDPQPNLILLDIHVDPYSGFDMLAMIRREQKYNDLPVVAFTASVMNEEIALLQTSGFQGVVSKPLNLEEFPRIIQRIMDGEQVWYVW